MIGVLAATLGLAGCGRKGGLDAPPSAQVVSPQPTLQQGSLGEPDIVGFEGEARPAPAPVQQQPAAVPPAQRTFILDPLIK